MARVVVVANVGTGVSRQFVFVWEKADIASVRGGTAQEQPPQDGQRGPGPGSTPRCFHTLGDSHLTSGTVTYPVCVAATPSVERGGNTYPYLPHKAGVGVK